MPKKPQYNLQRLLEIREQTREKAGLYLNDCRKQLALAESELQNRLQAVEDCRQTQNRIQQEMLSKSQIGMKSGEMIRYRQHLSDLREEEQRLLAAVDDQKKVVRRAEQTVERALAALAEASKEVKVIEKHKENWQIEQKVSAGRREQKLNDEIGAILYERLKSE